jgi:hypothetical protein
MPGVRKAVVLGLCLTSFLLIAAAPASARVAGGSPALFNREEYQVTPSTLRTDAHRYGVMVMGAADARFVRTLHRLNPRLQLLMYQNVPFATTTDPTGGMNCTTVPQDLAHPGWLARTASGAPVTGGNNFSTNVGNPGYQHACITHAIALAKSHGFDGIFLDNVCASFSWTVPSGVTPHPVQFPSDAAYQSAVYSLLSYAGPTVHAAGLKLFANISATDSAGWAKWNGPLDGAMEEAWTDGGLGPAAEVWWWREKLAEVRWSQAHGKYVLLHSYSQTETGNTFGLAAMMLLANGYASYSTSTTYVTRPRWLPEYTTARQLGTARGPYRIRRNGVYERVFAHGIVLVNPTRHRVRRFSLGGRYSGSHLRHARAAGLAPLSALILTRG